MHRVCLLIAVVLIMAGCATVESPTTPPVTAAAASAALPPQSIETPKNSVGDTWEYVRRDRATYTMTIVEASESGSVATVTSWPELRFHFDHDGTITKIEGEPSKVAPIAFFANSWKWLSFPLHVGKKWSFQAHGANAPFTVDVTVKKQTTVKTQAGTFEALQIDTCWRNHSNNWSDCGYQYWYAPSVKRIVKRETPNTWTSSLTNSDHELVSYTLAGQ